MKRNSQIEDSAEMADLASGSQVDDVKVTKEGGGFDTPAGTRGSRQTFTGPFVRWLDELGGTRIGRKVFRKLMGCDALVLTTIGRRSGTERTTRVGCFPGNGGSWLIVAAAGGTAANPAWYYNIAARPGKVQVGVEGRKVAVTAEQLHGAERAEAWRRITAASPQFARFQRKTDRELPVIRLMPRSGSTAPQYRHIGRVDMMWTSDPLRPRPSRMAKVLRRCEPVLGEQLDDAVTVLASAQRRIPDMIPRLTVPSKGARGHLEGILPVAAVYLELSDRFGQDRATKLTAACLDSNAERRARVLRLLDRTPWLFPVFGRSGRRMMRRGFSPPAFGVRWIEDSARRVRFDMTRCYYLDTLTTLAIPELTGLFCHGDEVMYGGLSHLRFARSGTLAQGCDRCDFCFERRPAGTRRSVHGAAP